MGPNVCFNTLETIVVKGMTALPLITVRRPNTPMTFPGQRVFRYRYALPDETNRTSCPWFSKCSATTAERIACPRPSPATPYNTRISFVRLCSKNESHGCDQAQKSSNSGCNSTSKCVAGFGCVRCHEVGCCASDGRVE